MSTFKRTSLIILALIAWTTFIALGFIKGYLLQPITSGHTPESFISATQDKIDEAFVGNFAMALIEDGQVAKDFFYAVNEEVVNENTVFQVASVSKWVTSFGVMKLVEQGKVDLDTPIDNYLTRWHLPKSEFDNQQVNIRRLLSHSSGLVDDLGYDGFGPDEQVQTIEESLTKAADAPYSEGVARVGYKPGSQYMYSGAAYTLLQLLIEEVSGESFQDYMTKEVFEPLQMSQSTFLLADKPNLQLAKRYNDDGTIAPPTSFTALAAASLFTCTADLTKFMQANVSANPVLQRGTIAKMSEAQTFINDTEIYGMGPHLYSQNDKNSRIIGHDGSSGTPVINTAARIDLLSKDGIIILEMGNRNIASNLADEWLYWKAGIADYVVMMRNKNYLLSLLGLGYLLIIGMSIFLIRRKR